MLATIRPGRLAGLLAAAMLWLTSALPAVASNNLLLPTATVTIINKNPASAGALYAFVVGQVATQNGAWYYVTGANGNVAAVPAKTTGLPAISLGTAANSTIQIPQMYNARIYLSFKKAPQITGGAGNVPSQPSGWTSSDPNYKTAFDWVEYAFGPGAPVKTLPTTNVPLNVDLTQVDMFGLAMFVQLTGTAGPTPSPTVTLSSGYNSATARQSIFNAMQKAGTPWSGLLVKTGKSVLRAFSPIHAPSFDDSGYGDDFADYIDDVYDHYQKTPLSVNVLGMAMQGRAKAGTLTFKQVGGTISISAPKPTLGKLVPGTPTVRSSTASAAQVDRLQALFSAAFLRTNLLVNADMSACNPKQFYVKGPIFQYSKIMHQYAYKHLAYGIAPDDQCSQSSDIEVFNPTAFTITVQPLGTASASLLGKPGKP